MQLEFIEQEKTEIGAKKEELESVGSPSEDQEQMWVKKKRSKPHLMRGWEMQLRANLGKVNEDSVWIWSWKNLIIPRSPAIAITFLVMNLSTWWRRVFCVFLCRSGKTIPVFGINIICAYISLKLRQEKLILKSPWIDRSLLLLGKRSIIQQALCSRDPGPQSSKNPKTLIKRYFSRSVESE